MIAPKLKEQLSLDGVIMKVIHPSPTPHPMGFHTLQSTDGSN